MKRLLALGLVLIMLVTFMLSGCAHRYTEGDVQGVIDGTQLGLAVLFWRWEGKDEMTGLTADEQAELIDIFDGKELRPRTSEQLSFSAKASLVFMSNESCYYFCAEGKPVIMDIIDELYFELSASENAKLIEILENHGFTVPFNKLGM